MCEYRSGMERHALTAARALLREAYGRDAMLPKDIPPDEQQPEIRTLIAHYDERGLNWIDIVAYHTAVFTGHWPVPRPESGRPRTKGVRT